MIGIFFLFGFGLGSAWWVSPDHPHSMNEKGRSATSAGLFFGQISQAIEIISFSAASVPILYIAASSRPAWHLFCMHKLWSIITLSSLQAGCQK
jgi:hypothetical protein